MCVPHSAPLCTFSCAVVEGVTFSQTHSRVTLSTTHWTSRQLGPGGSAKRRERKEGTQECWVPATCRGARGQGRRAQGSTAVSGVHVEPQSHGTVGRLEIARNCGVHGEVGACEGYGGPRRSGEHDCGEGKTGQGSGQTTSPLPAADRPRTSRGARASRTSGCQLTFSLFRPCLPGS